MLAWPAKIKLVKLAKACFPRPRAERPFGRGNDSHSGDPGCRPDRRISRTCRRPVTVAECDQIASLPSSLSLNICCLTHLLVIESVRSDHPVMYVLIVCRLFPSVRW